MEFKIIQSGVASRVLIKHNEKIYRTYLDCDMLQCDGDLSMYRTTNALGFLVKLVLTKMDNFKTYVEERNDLAKDIHGASSSTPREHLKISFKVNNNDVYFNAIRNMNEESLDVF